MGWLGTNSGKVIDLDTPSWEQINTDDIATGLSHVCRFNGQVKEFYSVAEHCIHVAELVPKEFRLQALLHDASEAYICDVPTPLKQMLGDAYYDVEKRVQHAIGKLYNIDLINLHAVVKQADRIMLVTEHTYLQKVPADWGIEYQGMIQYPNFKPLHLNPRALAQLYAKLVVEAWEGDYYGCMQ